MVSQDSYIDGRAGFLDSNFGSSTALYVGQSTVNNGGRKTYMQFDATSLPEIFSVDDFQVQRGGGTINRTIQLHAILGDNVDSWTQAGLTWNNAPGNNVAPGLREFAAAAGESVILLGNFFTGAAADTVYEVPFSGLSEASSQAILSALNSGDRKLTLGLQYYSSQDSSITFRSQEFGDGTFGPRLNITFVPEPATGTLLIGGGMLLLALRRRR